MQLGQGIVVHGEAHLDIHVVVHLDMIHEPAREDVPMDETPSIVASRALSGAQRSVNSVGSYAWVPASRVHAAARGIRSLISTLRTPRLVGKSTRTSG